MASLDQRSTSLAGKLLIAAPGVMEGSCFDRAVVFLCAHNAQGAMGIIVNHPVENLSPDMILTQLDIEAAAPQLPFKVHFGGPVEAYRGFVVHSDDYMAEGSLAAHEGIAVSGSLKLLQDIADGKGPSHVMLMLGYAGWGAGQLEKELKEGSWLVVPASASLVFTGDNRTKWDTAFSTLGIDRGHFSATVGHA